MLRKVCQWIVHNVFRVQEDTHADQIETYQTPCIYCGATVTAATWIPPERVVCVRTKIFDDNSYCSQQRRKAHEDRRQIELYKQAIREVAEETTNPREKS